MLNLCLRRRSQRRLVFCSLFLAQTAFAQNPFATEPGLADIKPTDVIHWSGAGAQQITPDTVEAGLRLVTEGGFTLYQDKVKFSGPAGMEFVKVAGPETAKLLDPISLEEVDVYTNGDFLVTFRGVVPEGDMLTVSVTYTGCTSVICLFPYTDTMELPLARIVTTASSNEASSNTSVETIPLQTATSQDTQSTDITSLSEMESYLVRAFNAGTTPLWLVMIIVFFGGAISNLTPCVYPMIPITLRILGTTGHSLWFSLCYGAGIVVTYTTLGIFAGFTGSMFGSFMQNVWVNVGFAALMFILAMQMLGFGNFAAIQNIGNRIGAGKPSARNTFLMGTGAGLVAAPCTGPIMLALLSYAAKSQDTLESILVFTVYSVGFALPYVFLGAGAAKLQKRRISFHVQIGVKVLFAAVIFALSFYYLRFAFHQTIQQLEPIWPYVMRIGIALGSGITLVFLVVPKLYNSKQMLMIPSLVLGIGLFGGYKVYTTVDSELNWYKTEEEGFAAAAREGKPIFIDGWAEWCIACIEMDQSTFLEPEVIEEMNRNWILIKLDLTESNATNDAITDKYNFIGLPSYALLHPDGSLNSLNVIAGKMDKATLLGHLEAYRKGLPE